MVEDRYFIFTFRIFYQLFIQAWRQLFLAICRSYFFWNYGASITTTSAYIADISDDSNRSKTLE